VSACPTVVTERLVLRPFRDGDLDAYTAVVTAPLVREALRSPPTIGRREAWAQMAAFLGMWELRGCGQWALEDRDSGALVGRAGLNRPEIEGWPGTEVGWALHPDHWGKGYATEAGAAAVRYGFEVLDEAELVSVILPDNTASQAVAHRLGFTLEEERVLAHFPAAPHGIWRLRRSTWARDQLTGAG
jgi:RimJ/RimL family protein N-acetyltransferase